MGTIISFKRPDGKDASGYLANAARGNAPGVVVIQEWWGLSEQIKGLTDRFALAGFDRTHVFQIGCAYELPFLKERTDLVGLGDPLHGNTVQRAFSQFLRRAGCSLERGVDGRWRNR